MYGKSNVIRRIPGFIEAAQHGQPVIISLDLDQDAPCPGLRRAQLAADLPPLAVLRLAVPSVEAWILADPQSLVSKLGVPVAGLPNQPDTLKNPKAVLKTQLLASKSARVREQIGQPRSLEDLTDQVFAGWLAKHARTDWEPGRAIASRLSPSLTSAARRIGELVAKLRLSSSVQ